MKNLLFISLISLLSISSHAQTFITKNGKISFFSSTSMENISAVNNQVVSVLDSKTGSFQFSVQIKGFIFKKALMQEHFNDENMESGKYPKAIFKGKVTDISTVNFSKDGNYKVNVSGDLTMHGVANHVTVPGSINITDGKVNASATFKLSVSDYKISAPTNVSNSIEIKVDCNYQPK
jgi:hypothetical protein